MLESSQQQQHRSRTSRPLLPISPPPPFTPPRKESERSPCSRCGGWSNKDGCVVETLQQPLRSTPPAPLLHLRAFELKPRTSTDGRSVRIAFVFFPVRLAASAQKKNSARIFPVDALLLQRRRTSSSSSSRSSDPFPLFAEVPQLAELERGTQPGTQLPPTPPL